MPGATIDAFLFDPCGYSCNGLLGVTMAEPGVSSTFAVRFEDWPDDERQAA